MSHAGLVPVMALAERAGLSELISSKVAINATPVRAAGVNAAGELTSIIAATAAGEDTASTICTRSVPAGCRGCSPRYTRL